MATNPGVPPTATGFPSTVGIASDGAGTTDGTGEAGWNDVVAGGGAATCCVAVSTAADASVDVALVPLGEPVASVVTGTPAGRPVPSTVWVVGLTTTATAMIAATASTAATTVSTVRRRERRRRRIIGGGPTTGGEIGPALETGTSGGS